MIRTAALLLALALAQPAFAQTAPSPAPKPSPTKPSPATKKPAPPKPDAAAQSGPCGIGVIPHIGENFVLQSIGITVFGNEFKKVPIESWGLDDLLVARVRAAAGPHFAVRRMAYPANAFATFDDPPPFHNGENDLKEIAQTVSRAGGCERRQRRDPDRRHQHNCQGHWRFPSRRPHRSLQLRHSGRAHGALRHRWPHIRNPEERLRWHRRRGYAR